MTCTRMHLKYLQCFLVFYSRAHPGQIYRMSGRCTVPVPVQSLTALDLQAISLVLLAQGPTNFDH